MLLAKVRDFFSPRDRLDEVAGEVNWNEEHSDGAQEVSAVPIHEVAGNEVNLLQPENSEADVTEPQTPAGDDSSAPCTGVDAALLAQQRDEEPDQAEAGDAEDRLTGAAAKLAQSITDCLDHFVLEASRRVIGDRDPYGPEAGAQALTEGTVREFDSRFAALGGGNKVRERNYRELASRLSKVEHELDVSRSLNEQLRTELLRIGESFKALSGQLKTQGTIAWSMEQMLHEQAQKIDERAESLESRMTKELEEIAHTLASHEEVIGQLNEVQSSLDQRLEAHAGVVDSFRRGSESQQEAWRKIAALASQVAQSFGDTHREPGPADGLQNEPRRPASEPPTGDGRVG